MFKFLALSLFISAAIANPVPSPSEDLVPRACTTVNPSIIDVLDSANPNTPSNGQQFTLKRTGSPLAQTKISAITFDYIPTGATGCTLEIEIPALAQNNQIAQGATDASIWTTDPWDYNSLPTWNNPPTKRAKVSSFAFPTQQTSQVTWQPLASNVCSDPMSFLVELSDWQQQEGSVDFFNTLGGKIGVPRIGFRMVYNC